MKKSLRFEIDVFGGVHGPPNAFVKGGEDIVFQIGHANPVTQCGQGSGAVKAGTAQLIGKIFDVPYIEFVPQILCGNFFDVVGFVQNEVFVFAQHGIFRDDVGKEQGVIDNHDMCFLGRAAYGVGKTLSVGAAFLRAAIPRVGTHFCPQAGIATHIKAIVFRNVAGLRLLCPYNEK